MSVLNLEKTAPTGACEGLHAPPDESLQLLSEPGQQCDLQLAYPLMVADNGLAAFVSTQSLMVQIPPDIVIVFLFCDLSLALCHWSQGRRTNPWQDEILLKCIWISNCKIVFTYSWEGPSFLCLRNKWLWYQHFLVVPLHIKPIVLQHFFRCTFVFWNGYTFFVLL